MSEDNVVFKIGCDPEIFLKKRGRFVSAEGVIPGDKKNPHTVSDDGAVQLDGLAAEFNTKPVPLYSPNDYLLRTYELDAFHYRVNSMIKSVREYASASGLTVSKDSYAEFDLDYYNSLPEDSKVLGCDPDFNAYSGDMNEIDRSPEFDNVRGAAGHIHIGWGEDIPIDHPDHVAICRDVVRAMDRWIGLNLVANGDVDIRRRKVYGKAGAFRPKPYGVEYRTPSNWWIWNQTRRSLVWAAAKCCMRDLADRRIFERISDEQVQSLLNDEMDAAVREATALDSLREHNLRVYP